MVVWSGILIDDYRHSVKNSINIGFVVDNLLKLSQVFLYPVFSISLPLESG
jgi:hypothetical protein